MGAKKFTDTEGTIGVFSPWRKFPDPRRGGMLIAPLGPGCYELRRADTEELILFGSSANVCARMSSLLPAPYGQGTRNNADKRVYVSKHLDCLEYRTLPCASKTDAIRSEGAMRAGKAHKFRS